MRDLRLEIWFKWDEKKPIRLNTEIILLKLTFKEWNDDVIYFVWLWERITSIWIDLIIFSYLFLRFKWIHKEVSYLLK
ncbi:MAG: hypothetical protein Ta2E_10710 [Mycoplasmoidaceae bacterium]|nr:MAG: hypothetical protein Ta2E_10710 [Mycoplasmoidaceae bacterium]